MEERENNELAYQILPEDFPHYDLSFKIILLGDSDVGKNDLVIKATKKNLKIIIWIQSVLNFSLLI